MIEQGIIDLIVVNLPNFLGLLVALVFMYRVNMRLLDKIDKCDCDPVDKIEEP